MKIALTFDVERDNPNFLDTYYGIKMGLVKILSVLDTYKIKGTFFCTGNVVKHLPEYIRLIERKDHELACHGLNHERLPQLNFKMCQDIIYHNKKLIENTCQTSEIIGFRAPYLDPPAFLFKVLNNLGFKYDSSIKSLKMLKFYQIKNCQIQEFHPSELSISFRLPMSYCFLRKWIFKKDLIVLYFHPWEAINMKNITFSQKMRYNRFKNIIFRPDRWINTGNSFITKLKEFIEETLSKKAKFIMLKELII